MKNFVKIIALVLALVCAMSLVSCLGGDDKKDEGKDNTRETTSNTTAATQQETYSDGTCLQHTFGEWQITKTATCQRAGSQSRTCVKCATVETQELPKGEHAFGEWVAVDPVGCETKGSRRHTCGVCKMSVSEAVEPLGHNYDSNDRCTLCFEYKYGTPGLLFTLQGEDDPYPNTYKVSRGTSLEPTCVIPAEFNGKPVTYIEPDGFSGSEIKRVVIPASVKKIHEQAFWYCTELEAVEFKSGSQLETLDGFLGCTSLMSVTVPASVTKVTASCFRECSNLNSVSFENTIGWFKGYMGTPDSQPAAVNDSTQNANTMKYASNNFYFFRLTSGTAVQ